MWFGELNYVQASLKAALEPGKRRFDQRAGEGGGKIPQMLLNVYEKHKTSATHLPQLNYNAICDP